MTHLCCPADEQGIRESLRAVLLLQYALELLPAQHVEHGSIHKDHKKRKGARP